MRKRIVIACDSFKGCLESGEVASAVAEGIERVMPEEGTEIVILEVADGGEGTGGILTKIFGGKLAGIADIDCSNVPKEILESEFIVACDVTTPFCGEEGASRVFARQKGADDMTMETLENGMLSFAEVISRKYGIDLNEIPGSGAAGGLGGAFKAFLNAELKSGIDMILDAAGFDEIIEDASLVITGEGHIDFQSGRGKVIDGIFRRCRTKTVPVLAIAGIVDDYCLIGKEADTTTVLPIGPRPQNESDLEHAMRPEVARKNISDTIARNLNEIMSISLKQSSL